MFHKGLNNFSKSFNKSIMYSLGSASKLSSSSYFTCFSLKNFSSKVYGNIVKQSEDLSICTRELLVPFNSKHSLIYFNTTDTLEQISQRIQSYDPKIQKVSFRELSKNKQYEPTTQIDSILDSPFELSINNDQKLKYLPSLNYIANKKLGFGIDNTDISNNFNFLMYNYLICPKIQKQGLDNYKKTVKDLLDNYAMIYEKLLEEQIVTNNLIEERIAKSQRMGSYFLLLASLAHLILFYLLIYRWYGWDQIEPITYITGNVYWILGLSFFILSKNRMDVTFFTSNFFRSYKYGKQFKRLSFDIKEKEFIETYLEQIKVLKQSLSKI